MATLITADQYPLWNSYGGISSWLSAGVMTEPFLDLYYDYKKINYGDISFAKWIWRFLRYNTQPRKFFDIQVSFNYTEDNQNSPYYQNEYENSLDWFSKPNRFDINTAGTGFGGNILYDDLWRMRAFPLEQRLHSINPSLYDKWYWPIDGTKSIQAYGGFDDGTEYEFDAYSNNQTLSNPGPQGTNDGYFTGQCLEFSVYPVHNCHQIIYSVDSENQLDSIQGMVIAPIVSIVWSLEYGTPITYSGGQATRTVYKTFKSIEIGGYVLNSSYVTQNQYDMGFRTSNSTIEIDNFSIGGLNMYIKTIERDYDDNDVAGGSGTNYTYGGSVESVNGIDSNVTQCKITPEEGDFNEAFISSWGTT